MTMITDGLKAKSLEESIRQLDIAEILLEACGDGAKGEQGAKGGKDA